MSPGTRLEGRGSTRAAVPGATQALRLRMPQVRLEGSTGHLADPTQTPHPHLPAQTLTCSEMEAGASLNLCLLQTSGVRHWLSMLIPSQELYGPGQLLQLRLAVLTESQNSIYHTRLM